MSAARATRDAVVIGGGFYGAAISVFLAQHRGMSRVLLVEREAALLTRASYRNQARVHNGHHYPRSLTTARRSRVNFPRFVRDWPDAIERDYTKLYAIARRNSKLTSRQFARFCREIGAPVGPAEAAHRALFEPRLIEDVFSVEECVFDATKLASQVNRELGDCGVELRLDTEATGVTLAPDRALQVTLQTGAAREEEAVSCRRVFNCTYSGLNRLKGAFPGTRARLKHELTEIALITAPAALEGLGITVMDGPFFSMLPFPARGLHTLSHVRYTPHLQWVDHRTVDPYQRLERYERATRVDRMVRDAGRYLPALRDARHVDSLFEVKTVLCRNEGDDGRPILFEQHAELPGCYSVLGGKIDNIYDILELVGRAL